jgi:hypothetical protein
MLLLGVLAIGTGSVLLLGYVLAAASLGVILFIMARKVTRRIGDARLAKPRLVSRLPAVMSRSNNDNPRRAA